MTQVTPALPDEHAALVSALRGIVSDYPYVDPVDTLEDLALDAEDAARRADTPEGRRARAGLTVLLHATCWYAASGRVVSKRLLRSYLRALDAVGATLDPSACTCGEDGHPDDLAEDLEHAVRTGAALLSEDGRAALAAEYGPEELAALDCEDFLDELAGQAEDRIREGWDELFGEVDVSRLDAQFARPGGGIDVLALQDALDRTWERNADAVALWSARRLLSGEVRPEDRLGVLLCLRMGIGRSHDGLPPSYARDLKAALGTVPADAACDHPRHPWPAAGRTHGARRDAVRHLCAPEQYPQSPVPPELDRRELWECPAQYAELALEALTDLDNSTLGEDEE